MSFVLAVLCFLSGIVLCLNITALPAPMWCWALAITAPLSVIRTPLTHAAFGLSGFLWALLFAHQVLHQSLPLEYENQEVQVQGVIANLPERKRDQLRFEFAVSEYRIGQAQFRGPDRLLLNWPKATIDLVPGAEWCLTVKLKRPHGFRNPGGFDYEKWLFQKGIRATGTVRNQGDNITTGRIDYRFLIHRIRYHLAKNIDLITQDHPEFAGVFKALTLGDRSGISKAQWQVFMNTGTNHLVAISGLHIGLVAGFAFFLGRRAARFFPSLLVRWPAQKIAGLTALAAAFCYAALAGFSVPTQRALIMTAVALWALLGKRRLPAATVLSIALLLVLLIDPLAILSAGFWLSFAAVAIIFLGMSGRLDQSSLWWKWGRVQWVVSLALIPFLMLLFQRFSIISPLANLIAVPWVSLLVVPLALVGLVLGLLSVTLGSYVAVMIHYLLQLLWWVMEWVAASPMAVWSQHTPSVLSIGLLTVSMLLLLAPRGIPGKFLIGVLALPAFVLKPDIPPAGEAWITLLDVGQGEAVTVQTRHHLLLYDTGARMSADMDSGASVIVPFLRESGLRSIDMLVVSHNDMDHRGGLKSILDEVPVQRLLGSDELPEAPNTFCESGESWDWDGVRFEFLHPSGDHDLGKNDRSCVLRVATNAGSILIAGDVEAPAEQRIVERLGSRLQSNVLIAPHHGSMTSSTEDFIDAVAPQTVLFPVGYVNC
ncbi:MAG: DNA internalization-related competence protein ComEC/Rec2, partial [Gammaproteobacteria bacterium]|nr:DNA internalization-related competence protein ComEC/Rec2 [Gammaproteobacteria bacterium]